jgi:hypothetical protein
MRMETLPGAALRSEREGLLLTTAFSRMRLRLPNGHAGIGHNDLGFFEIATVSPSKTYFRHFA